MNQYHRDLRIGAVMCELHVRLKDHRRQCGESATEHMRRPVSITLPLGDWHLIKAAVADAVSAMPQPDALVPYDLTFEPKRRWWRAGPDRRQDIRGALAMLAGSGIGIVVLLVALACTTLN